MAKHWDKDDLKIIRRRYANEKNEDLAKILYRSPSAIAIKANKMGLRKSDVFLAQRGFQKGYIPYNKGRKMEEWLSPEVHEKIKDNQSLTADRNRTKAMPEGTISRRYNGDHIKLGGRWVKLSHHVWTAHNSPIPDGMAVFYRDGNHFNTDIENLYIDVKNNASVVLANKSPEERRVIAAKTWETRRRKANEKYSELDAILADIHKSNNNIYYKSKI